MEFENNALFWQKVDAIFMSGDYKTIYKKGTVHPHYRDLVFPADYGHVMSEKGNDEEPELKVFKGNKGYSAQAIVICANILEKTVSSLVLIGLSEEEIQDVLHFLNGNEFQKTVIIRKGRSIPSWATAE